MSNFAIRGTAKAALFVLVCVFMSACSASQDGRDESNMGFILYPQVVPNPNPNAPLVAILEFETHEQTRVSVDMSDGDLSWSRDFGIGSSTRRRIPLLGFQPGRKSALEIKIEQVSGGAILFDGMLEFTAPVLPKNFLDFPPIDITKLDADRREPAITLLGVRRRALGRPEVLTPAQRQFTTGWGMILALDPSGRIIWYYQAGTRVAGIDSLHNGNILFHETGFRTREIDFTGNIQNEWYAEKRPQGPSDTPGAIPIQGIQTLHHQPHQMPNGNFLAFTANAREVENFYTSETDPNAPRQTQYVMGDDVIEFNRDGEVVWRWSAWDHLDPFRIGYDTFWSYWWVRGFPEHADWTHANGLAYDPSDNSVIISLREQDAIIKIDRATGNIKWIIGEHTDWPEHLQAKLLTPVGDLAWPYHQHNPRLTGDGTIIAFDNHKYAARPFSAYKPAFDSFSRAVEYRVNEQDMTIEQVWASASERNEDSCFSTYMGDAMVLPKTGNRLVVHAICEAYVEGISMDNTIGSRDFHLMDPPKGARVREHAGDDPNDIVFELLVKDPNELIQWEVYGGVQVKSLYGPANRAIGASAED